jgi:hypothetical protein
VLLALALLLLCVRAQCDGQSLRFEFGGVRRIASASSSLSTDGLAAPQGMEAPETAQASVRRDGLSPNNRLVTSFPDAQNAFASTISAGGSQ